VFLENQLWGNRTGGAEILVLANIGFQIWRPAQFPMVFKVGFDKLVKHRDQKRRIQGWKVLAKRGRLAVIPYRILPGALEALQVDLEVVEILFRHYAQIVRTGHWGETNVSCASLFQSKSATKIMQGPI